MQLNYLSYILLQVHGKIDTLEWPEAPLTSEFIQLEPNRGVATTRRTEINICQYEDNLYFLFVCHIDVGDDDLLNRILWFSAKGPLPYPSKYDGKAEMMMIEVESN